MAWFSGLLFLLLAFYMTGDALSRSLGGPFTGVSDQIASFALALGATWALAHGVVAGTHVRSDVLLPLLPTPLKRWFGVLALSGLTVFAWIISYSSYLLTLESYEMGSTVPQSIIEMPLYIPQAISAFGFVVFAVTALVSTVIAILTPTPIAEDGGI
jgi:TRAP-type C4-dicarboxylate transport system permease small subunit